MPIKHRNKIIILSLALLGIFLVSIGSFQGERQKSSSEEYIRLQEAKIEEFLKEVEGIRDAKVIITLEEAEQGETDAFFDTSKASSSLPMVRGVAIACTNGDNYQIQAKVTSIVSSYLGISSNRVKIVAIK